MSNLIGKNSHDRWYPNPIFKLKNHLEGYQTKTEFLEKNDIQANVCYNLQYIEYLRKTLNELNLSEVLQIQTIKSFIVISVSIIEAYFYIIVCNETLRKKIEWIENKTLNKSEFEIEKTKYHIESKLFKKTNGTAYEKPTFDFMIKTIESNNILKIDHQFFKDLNHLRKLRNKIHLQEIGEIGKTDYKSFWLPEYNLSKKCLKMFLINDLFIGKNFDSKLFDFLNVIEK
jgi:hypothetical protein